MKHVCSGLLVVFVLALLLPVSARALAGSASVREGNCRPHGICGLRNPEDVVRLGDSKFAIASSLARAPGSTSHLYLVDMESGTAVPLVPVMGSKARLGDARCPPPEGFGELVTHGLAARSDGRGHGRLYVVNHGKRQSVEIFKWSTDDAGVRLEWQGCVTVPPGVSANAVAPLPDGLALTSFGSANDPGMVDLMAGRPSGFVVIWTRGNGWTRLKGSELPADNGIEASPDGKLLYVNAWGSGALWVIARNGDRRPLRIPLGDFHPDNVHWQGKGVLLIAGQVGAASGILACGPRGICPMPSMLVTVDVARRRVVERLQIPPTADFGAASTAIRYKGHYWLSSFLGDRMVEVPASVGTSGVSSADGH